MTDATLIKKIASLERDLQEIKLDFMRSKRALPLSGYSEQDIVREVRKVRKENWDGKYSRKK